MWWEADRGVVFPLEEDYDDADGLVSILNTRAPYFSNGSAPTLRAVVDFYTRRYSIPYSEQQKQDLVNFLRSL